MRRDTVYFTGETLELLKKNTQIPAIEKAVADRKRDAYLRRKYGISLNEYNEMLDKQSGVCYVCQKPPVTRSLAVDHDHKFLYIKRRSWKDNSMWFADADYRGLRHLGTGLTRSGAVQALKKALSRSSIRGLLCPNCNSGLRKYSDDPERFERAAKYLRDFTNLLS